MRGLGWDGPLGPPPEQNPASRFPAPGSHLGSTEDRVPHDALSRSNLVCALFTGPESGARFARYRFPLVVTPSLHRVRGRYHRVPQLLRYYEPVRLLRGIRRFMAHACPPLPAASIALMSGAPAPTVNTRRVRLRSPDSRATDFSCACRTLRPRLAGPSSDPCWLPSYASASPPVKMRVSRLNRPAHTHVRLRLGC